MDRDEEIRLLQGAEDRIRTRLTEWFKNPNVMAAIRRRQQKPQPDGGEGPEPEHTPEKKYACR